MRALSPEEWVRRFLGRCEVDSESECILYMGSRNGKGYGTARLPLPYAEAMGVASRVTGAHRILYFLVRGLPSPDMHLDHLCNTRACVNPYHLAEIDPLSNSYRAVYYQHYGITSQEQMDADQDPFGAVAYSPEY